MARRVSQARYQCPVQAPFRMLGMQPLPRVCEQLGGRLQAGLQAGIGNRIAFIVVDIALAAQGVEQDQVLLVHAQGLVQRLDRRLMVAGLAGGRAPAMGPQAQHGALQHALVGGIESVAGTDLRHLRIRQIALRRLKQLAHAPGIRRMRLQAADGLQVVQAHGHPPVSRVWVCAAVRARRDRPLVPWPPTPAASRPPG